MHDVFLSYAHANREQARRIVAWLADRGYSVWWDPDLVPSRNYLREIEESLRQARCVVVLWTRDSVASDFVLEEASIAREQRKLVGALLQDAERPVSFRLIQAADLRGWNGEQDHPGIRQLDAGIRACLGASPPPASPPVTGPAPRWTLWLALLAPSLLAALAVCVLSQWPATTSLEADVSTTRLRFYTRAAAPQSLLDAMPLRSLAIRGFEMVRLPRARTWAPGSGGRDVPLDGSAPLVLRPSGSDPARVSISPAASSRELLSIDSVFARAAEVIMDAPEPGSIALTLRGAKVQAGVSLPAETQMIATSCAASDAAWPADNPSVTLRSRFDLSDRLLEFESGEGALRLVLGLAPDRNQATLKGDLAGDHIEFQRQSAIGPVESAIATGTLRFHGRSENLNRNDFLVLEPDRQFLLRRVELSREGVLRVQIFGTAGAVTYGPGAYLKRERFTMLSALATRPALTGAVAVAAWLLPTLPMWRRFRRRRRIV